MTKDRIVAFARELAHLVKQARGLEAMLDEIRGNLAIAKETSDVQAIEQMMKQRPEIQKAYEAAKGLAQQKANRPELEACERLLNQLQIRLEEHQQYDIEAERLAAQFEMATAMNEFVEKPENRAEFESILATARDRAVKQLELASDLVPDKPVLLAL